MDDWPCLGRWREDIRSRSLVPGCFKMGQSLGSLRIQPSVGSPPASVSEWSDGIVQGLGTELCMPVVVVAVVGGYSEMSAQDVAGAGYEWRKAKLGNPSRQFVPG